MVDSWSAVNLWVGFFVVCVSNAVFLCSLCLRLVVVDFVLRSAIFSVSFVWVWCVCVGVAVSLVWLPEYK